MSTLAVMRREHRHELVVIAVSASPGGSDDVLGRDAGVRGSELRQAVLLAWSKGAGLIAETHIVSVMPPAASERRVVRSKPGPPGPARADLGACAQGNRAATFRGIHSYSFDCSPVLNMSNFRCKTMTRVRASTPPT